jgi:hypothetical protein
MPEQIIDICGQPHIFSCKPMAWYKWYCNKCHLKGKTTRRDFVCHEGKTRIVVDDEVKEE